MHGPLKLVPGPTFGPTLTDTEPTVTTGELGLLGEGLGDGDRGLGDGDATGVEEEVGLDRGDGAAGETGDGDAASEAGTDGGIGVDGAGRGVRPPPDRGTMTARSDPGSARWCRCAGELAPSARTPPATSTIRTATGSSRVGRTRRTFEVIEPVPFTIMAKCCHEV